MSLLLDTELDNIERRFNEAQKGLDEKGWLLASPSGLISDALCLLAHIKVQDGEIAALRAKLNRYAPPEMTEEAANTAAYVAPVRYVYSGFGKLRPATDERCECVENCGGCHCKHSDEDF